MLMASSNAIGKASEILGNAKIEADFNRGRIWLVVPQKNILLVRPYFFIKLRHFCNKPVELWDCPRCPWSIQGFLLQVD